MASDKITAAQILLPVSLISVVLVLFLGFQATLLVSDHTSLQQARTEQEAPLEQANKVKAQVNALTVGTLKLSKTGNKDAQNIIAELKKSGIDVNDQQPATNPTKAPTAP